MSKIIIEKEAHGERLDKFLMSQNLDISRSKIQKMIKAGLITVNEKKVSPHCFLKENDIVEFDISKKDEEIPSDTTKKPNLSNTKTEELFKKIEIIHEAKDYIIINKPSGLIVHDGEGVKEKTLVDYLLKKYPELKKVGEDNSRPGIVHRLDKEASGIMVIARNRDSFYDLKEQFQKRKTKKYYSVLVYGQITKDEDEINFPIARSSSGKMAALPYLVKGEVNKKGKKALTTFRINKKYINYTLLDVNIKTGRTHQVRTHMAAYGHPVVGDNVYSTKRTREQNKKLNLGRIFLVAKKLSFVNLNKEEVEHEIELPEELEELLKKIK